MPTKTLAIIALALAVCQAHGVVIVATAVTLVILPPAAPAVAAAAAAPTTTVVLGTVAATTGQGVALAGGTAAAVEITAAGVGVVEGAAAALAAAKTTAATAAATEAAAKAAAAAKLVAATEATTKAAAAATAAEAATTTAAVASGPWGWIVLGADTDKYTYDCWKPVVRDESVEPSAGMTLRALCAHPNVRSVTATGADAPPSPFSFTVTNIKDETFGLSFVGLSGVMHTVALHATRIDDISGDAVHTGTTTNTAGRIKKKKNNRKTLATIALALAVCQAHANCPTETTFFGTNPMLTYMDTPTKMVGSGIPPPAPEEPDDAHGLRLIIDRCVERAGPRWTPADKSAAAEQYLAIFQRGDASALTGAMAEVWGEHVLFTKQYQSHLRATGRRWHQMIPANFKQSKASSSSAGHGITAAGKRFALPGMAAVQAKQGWTDAQLAKAVAAYGQFVRAVLANKEWPKAERGGLAPSHAVDEVWHQHIRFQAAYRTMSAALLGGRRRFLHHAPHISDADSASDPSSYVRTLKLIGDSGETPGTWAWPRASKDNCRDCGIGCRNFDD
jgi:hypothetical protein